MTCADAVIKPLPGRKGLLIGFRESLAYIINPDRFIEERVNEFGPVFGTTLFFKKTAVVGGATAVEGFIKQESSILTSSLPATFTELHTVYGAMNQSGERHQSTRAGYAPLFTNKAFQSYAQTIDRSISKFTSDTAQQDTSFIAKEAKRFCLNLFAEIFAGEQLSEQELKAFETYNKSLLSLSKKLPSFKKGMDALEELKGAMRERLSKYKGGSSKASCFDVFRQNRDENNAPWSDERIATATILLIWGAYIEVASLMVNSLILTEGKQDVRAKILEEAKGLDLLKQGEEHPLKAWDLPYTQGVLRESLRLIPPGGGGFRITSEAIQIAGFNVPAGYVVTADPRIGNRMPRLFPEPAEFHPERWIRTSKTASSTDETNGASRCPFAGTAALLTRSTWFPGGTGSHGCPGIPLAELTCRIFLVRWMQSIESWQRPLGDPKGVPYDLLPIKVPTDAYRIQITAVDRHNHGLGLIP